MVQTTVRAIAALALAVGLAFGAGCSSDETLKITSIEPKEGTYAGGNVVTIHGNGFQKGGIKGAKVYFGNSSAKVLGFVGDSKLRVEAPGGKVGEEVDITIVFEAEGNVEVKKAYKYIEPSGLDVTDLTEGDKGEDDDEGEE